MKSNKEKFQKFIERIYLEGAVDRILIKVYDDHITSQAFIQEKVFGARVTLHDNIFNIKNNDLAIVNLESLHNMIKSMPDDVDVLLMSNENNINDTKLHKLVLKNDLITSNFILGKKAVIKNHKSFIDLNNIEEWLFVYDFSDFIESFKKYENVLKDYDTFFFSCKDTVHINFGGLKTMSENLISIDLRITPKKKFKNTLLFDKDLFKSIINKNADSNLMLHVNDRLYYLTCEDEGFEAEYFNTKTKNQ